jgi:hypothetical protein
MNCNNPDEDNFENFGMVENYRPVCFNSLFPSTISSLSGKYVSSCIFIFYFLNIYIL